LKVIWEGMVPWGGGPAKMRLWEYSRVEYWCPIIKEWREGGSMHLAAAENERRRQISKEKGSS
jgi:hypothetical protein